MRPSRRVMLLTVVAVACGVLIVGIALAGIEQPRRNVDELVERVLPASKALERAAEEHAASHQLFLDALGAAPHERPTLISDAQDAGTRANAAWRQYRRLAFDSPAELRLQRRYERSVTESAGAGATVFGLVDSPDQNAFAVALAKDQRVSGRTLATLGRIDEHHYTSRLRVDVRDTGDGLSSVRSWILIVFAIVLVLGLLNAFIQLRGAFREERAATAREEERHHEQHRADLENQLQRGLEMEPEESATYGVIGDALRLVRSDGPAELLIADASNAHFRQVLSTDPAGLPGCDVTSPADCPAANSGQPRLFVSSTRLDACPHLRSREGGPMSAVCVPISITGGNAGVVHTTGPDGRIPDSSELVELGAHRPQGG